MALTRSGFIASAAALSVAAEARPAAAQTAGPLSLQAFVSRISSSAAHKQALAAPRMHDGAIFKYIVNAGRGFTSGWNEPASSYAPVGVLFGSGTMLALNDSAWAAVRPSQLAARYPNEFVQESPSANPFAPAIADLIAKGARFAACDTALADIARLAQVPHEQLQGALLPGIDLVPAGIAALAVLQEHGYTYFFAGV